MREIDLNKYNCLTNIINLIFFIMNKKIFGLLLVSASLFSVCTLESCKDTNEDLYQEIRITQSEQYKDLLNRICTVDCEALKQEVAALKDKLYNATTGDIPTILAAIEELENKYEALQKQVTGLTVKAVYTPALGSLNTCIGINSSLLLTYYGQANTAFEIGGESFSGELVCADEAGAGKIYLTVDPANVDFTGKEVALVNTKGEEVGVTLSPLAVSEEELTFGYTRAEEATKPVYLYETSASVKSAADVKHLSVDVDAVKTAIKDVVSYKDGINLTAIAEIVKNVVNQDVAMASVQITNADDYETRVVLSSGLSVGAAAVKPLNLDTYKAAVSYVGGAAVEAAVKAGDWYAEIDGAPSPAKVQKAIEKIVNKAVASTAAARVKTLAQPALFVIDGGVLRLVSQDKNNPTVVNNKNVTLVTSSYSLELLVPFFKKCVEATGATVENAGKAVDGCTFTSAMTVNGAAELVYTVADYAGNKAAVKGYVTVK